MNRTLIAFLAAFVWFVGVALGQTLEIAGEPTIAMPQQVRFLTSDAQFDDSFPSVASDGKRIVFSRRSARPGTKYRLWVIGPDGSDLRPLSPEDFELSCTRPAWSPDGRTIAFRAGRTDENAGGIWLIASDGSNLRRLTDEKKFDDLYPAWAPDGTWLVFSRGPITQEPNNDLWQVRLDGWQRQLTRDDSFEGRSSVAPDGHHIAFSSDRGGHHYPDTNIWTMTVDDGEASIVPFTFRGGAAPAWSPDGVWIAFTSNRDGGYAVYLKRAKGGPSTRVTEAVGQDKSHPSWFPDGKWIAFDLAHTPEQANIAVVDVRQVVTTQ